MHVGAQMSKIDLLQRARWHNIPRRIVQFPRTWRSELSLRRARLHISRRMVHVGAQMSETSLR